MGGDMDGMGDLDNAPMPPMGADNMGGEDPMSDPMGGAPDNMGGESPMDDPMGGGDTNAMGGEDDELMNIINGLSIEDKAAVTKYAKSMANDSEGGEDPMMGSAPDMGGEMPMESRRNVRSIIDEVLNDVLDNKEGTKRPEKKMPRQYRDMEMPFKSPF